MYRSVMCFFYVIRNINTHLLYLCIRNKWVMSDQQLSIRNYVFAFDSGNDNPFQQNSKFNNIHNICAVWFRFDWNIFFFLLVCCCMAFCCFFFYSNYPLTGWLTFLSLSLSLSYFPFEIKWIHKNVIYCTWFGFTFIAQSLMNDEALHLIRIGMHWFGWGIYETICLLWNLKFEMMNVECEERAIDKSVFADRLLFPCIKCKSIQMREKLTRCFHPAEKKDRDETYQPITLYLKANERRHTKKTFKWMWKK